VAGSGTEKGNVVGQVIHIQSPDLRKTYIQAGASRKGKEKAEPLGIELPWVGLQVKRLGRRAMSFEFGLVDARGREGVVRISSYKVRSRPCPWLLSFHRLINSPMTNRIKADGLARKVLLFTLIAHPHSFICRFNYLQRINTR
jgi:hypothetical protein